MTSKSWIYTPFKDILFVSCCTILSPLVVLIYLSLSRPDNIFGFKEASVAFAIWFIFEGLFDNPHIFRTFARTHADQVEFKRHKIFHTYGLAALILLGFSSLWFNYTEELYFAVAVIGSWHIFKQNIGFLRVYIAKARHSQWLKKTDLFFFYNLFFYYLSGYFFKKDLIFWSDVSTPLAPYLTILEKVIIISFIASTLLAVMGNAFIIFKTRAIAVPKLIFLISIGLTYFFLRHIILLCPIIIIIVAETIYHDIQYQVWMNHYQEKRFGTKMKFLNKWFLASLAYGIFFLTVNEFIFPAEYISMLGFMIILYHYLADGIIWKFSKQSELSSLIS